MSINRTLSQLLSEQSTALTFNSAPTLSSLTASKPVFTDASKGLVSTGTLAYDQGGTGLTSYTAGDVIYASGANTVARLAIGTTGQRLVVAAGLPSWSTDATIGTVTSVSWTGGIVSVATATTTPALTVAGTSGGIPYFSSTSTWATSAALAANALVIGGGAGAAPATTTTGTGVVTALGVNTGTAGAFVVDGGALGTPASGTVTNLTGTASININGTVGATTAAAGAFTTGSFSSTLGVTGTSTLGVVNSGALAVTGAGTFSNTVMVNTTNDALQLQSAATNASVMNLGAVAASYTYLQTAKIGTGTTRPLRIYSDSTQVAEFSSTGLSIPGTLGVTGTSTLAAINASGAVEIASGLTFSQGGVLATTYGDGNSLHAVVKNTTNAGSMNLRYGTASVKSILYANDSNGDGNSAGIGTTTNHTFSLLANGVIGLTLTPSGNAVTIPGTLGVTGASTFSTSITVGTAASSYGIISAVQGTNATVSGTNTFWQDTAVILAIRNLSNTANTVAGLRFGLGSADNAVAAIAGVQESTTLGALAFYTGGSGRSSTVPERMRITSAGYVGINTSTPADFGAFAIRKAATTGNMTNCSFSTSDASNSTFDIGHPSASVVALSSQNSHMTFSAGGGGVTTERMRIDKDSGRLDVHHSIYINNTTDVSYLALRQGYFQSTDSNTSLTIGCDSGGSNGIRFRTYSGGYDDRMTISAAGAVAIAGSLSKGSGSFQIPHPLPALNETHNLVHSFIEGPQADLIYRGRVSLVAGKATVNIDTASTMTEGTFELLCRDVQCVTSNETDWSPVRGSVVGNILTIECQDVKSTATISWVVIGERQDKHMMDTEWTDDDGKVIVEPLKPIMLEVEEPPHVEPE